MSNNKIPKLQPPLNTSHPFIAYGIFRPGDISFLLIKDFVQYNPESIEIKGDIKVRDGVKIFSGNGNETVSAYLIHFTSSEADKAYEVISNKESYYLYIWSIIDYEGMKCNILEAINMTKGSINYKEAKESGIDFWTIDQRHWEDAFQFLYSEIKSLQKPEVYSTENILDFGCMTLPEIKNENLFRIQQNYLFLWSMIERFSYYRFGGENSIQRIEQLFREFSSFLESGDFVAKEVINFKLKQGELFSSETLRNNHKIEKGAINFYFFYSVRNNMVHTFKTMNHDIPRTFYAFIELFFLFKHYFTVSRRLCHQLRDTEDDK